MRASEQVERLLSLVPYLQARSGVTVTRAAADFGITPRQLRGDLSVLYMCGLPGLMPGDLIDIDMDAVDGEGTIHLSNADYLLRPLRLTPDEALALVLGLRTLRDVAAGEQLAAVESALLTLEGLAGQHAGADRVDVAVTSAGDELRAVLATAVEQRQRLELVYDAPARTSRRRLDPARLSVRDGVAYLEAFDVDRGDWRTFRLDRVAEAAVIGASEDHGPLPEPVSDWREVLGGAGEVELELSAAAAWVAEYHPVLAVTPGEVEGSLRVRLPLSDPGWLRALLLQLGGEVRVCSPAEAAVAAAEAAAQTLARYDLLDAATRAAGDGPAAGRDGVGSDS